MRTHNQKLDDAQVSEILERYAKGETQTALAKEYGVDQSRISQLVKRHREPQEKPATETQEALDARYCGMLKKELIAKYRENRTKIEDLWDECNNRKARLGQYQMDIERAENYVLSEKNSVVTESEKEKIKLLKRQVHTLKDTSGLTKEYIELLRHQQSIAKALYHSHGVSLFPV